MLAMSPGAQAETVAFLSRGAAYGAPGAAVERRETHISIVFLVGDRAFKLKRAVAFSYLDFSTVESRRKNCEAELRLGRAMAPVLYHAIHAVTRAADGTLALDGRGNAVDWLVEMRRFDDAALFDRLAAAGRLTPGLMRDLADTVAVFHAVAEPAPRWGTPDAVHAVIVDIVDNLRRAAIFDTAEVTEVAARLAAEFAVQRATIERRNREGKVRRCHGDLHLRNICLLDGRPTLFDPIEFSDAIASIDVLYDLAFLLMDLAHRGYGELATLVFNRYLDASNDSGGLGLMPMHLTMRAAIRAHVTAADGAADAARSYFRLASDLLRSVPPTLVAIGGVSGTGKTMLAQAIAPRIGRAPGARVLRSDVIRKRLHGVAPELRLPQSAYDMPNNLRVYETLSREAATALRAGQAVVADAAFLRESERTSIAAVAREVGVTFVGLWLEAPEAVLVQRLAARHGDASDADAAVLRLQLAQDHGAITWQRIAAADDAAGEARVALMAIGAP
ncbi:MAG: AAA family ATPase [Alphaproteobacteria bacterium]|nr:AAA family ATPase [Alphaproteobacteria bacterium]